MSSTTKFVNQLQIETFVQCFPHWSETQQYRLSLKEQYLLLSDFNLI